MDPYHDSFHVPGPGPYALTHAVGCLPRVSVNALQERFIQPWAVKGGDVWGEWLDQIDIFRRQLAALLGGSPKEYCPQVNLSAALTNLLTALKPGSQKRVLIAAEDSFPSIGFVLKQAERWNYELRLIGRDHSPADVGTWNAALSPDVCAAVVTHVHSNTGEVAPLAEIGRLCRERDVVSIVDIAQSAGILPISLSDLNLDVALGSCVKWLCGGPGAGFLWIRDSLIPALEPAGVGWFSHENPFEFDIHHFQYAADARRFWGGTPSIVPFVVAGASIQFLSSVGVPAILSHNRRLMSAFIDEIPSHWRAQLNPDRTGGTLCIPTGNALNAIQSSLQRNQVRFDNRGDVIRLSFHICNRIDDAIRTGRAWREGC